MACYHPMNAVRLSDGSVKFVSKHHPRFESEIILPCGQCWGCRLERSRQWAVRCMHEASLHDSNLFVTLTYSDENIPPLRSLRYSDFQLFMKRLRKKFPGVSFYVGGEYGELTARPHYHACLFNLAFDDMEPLPHSPSGEKLYRSATLERLWPLGHSSFGYVSFESAAYISRYCMKKVTGDLAESHYAGREPEFNHMSLKPAVGKRWLEKYHKDVYPHDYVVVNGVEARPPKYYDKWLKGEDPSAFLRVAVDREILGYERREDNTPERLAVKEAISKARVNFKRRSLS